MLKTVYVLIGPKGKYIGENPKCIVNTAKRKSKEDGVKYDKIFCVFDRDNDSSAFQEATSCVRLESLFQSSLTRVSFSSARIGFGSPQQMIKALKKLSGFENYDKDGVQIFNTTIHLIDMACKRASSLVSKQDDDAKEDPFTNIHILIKRFQALKEEQNYFGPRERP